MPSLPKDWRSKQKKQYSKWILYPSENLIQLGREFQTQGGGGGEAPHNSPQVPTNLASFMGGWRQNPEKAPILRL